MFQTKIVEKIKTHILCSVTFFENLAVYEIMWKNMVRPDRPQRTIWRNAHCMLDNSGYKHTLTICNNYCFSTATLVTRTRINITLYVLWLSCTNFIWHVRRKQNGYYKGEGKVKIRVQFTLEQARKAYGVAEVPTAPLFLIFGTTWRWAVNFTPQPFCPPK